MSLKLLSLSEVKQCITMAEAIKAMESAFIQLAKQKVVLPLRTGIPVQDNGLTLTMPGYLAQEKILGLKVVSVFPNNIQQNKASINGVILLLDATTGEPLALMDATYLTALRTGAVSGLATQYFSKEEAKTVAIIGSGIQAATQLEAVAAVRDIQRVFVWSRNPENTQKFTRQLEPFYDIYPCNEIATAVKEADIICTATASTNALIHHQDIQPHVHINAIGSHSKEMHEISEDVLKNALVIVDQKEAAMAEAGEIISAIEQGKLNNESMIEIGEWLINKPTDFKEKLTVFKSVGLAIQDLAVAQVVYQNASKMQLGLSYEMNKKI